MTTQENNDPGNSSARINAPAQGDFPFPLSDTDQESKYLTWVRNHSSYLAVGGFLNWAGAVAAYVRGVLGNLLVLMPILIVLGGLLGWFHAELLDSPLRLSRYAFLCGVVVLLLYFGRNIGLRYSTEQSANSLSSFWPIAFLQGFWRLLVSWNCYWNPFWIIDRLWRNLTAWVLIAIGFCLLIDLSPQVIEFVRKRAIIEDFGLKECAAAVLAAISSVGGLIQLLPKSKSLTQKIVVISVAILSFGIVWGISLRIANYFYYGLPPHGAVLFLPFACIGILILSFVFQIVFSKDAGWKRRLTASIGVLIFAALGIAVAVLLNAEFRDQLDHSKQTLGSITRPLARLVNGVDDISLKTFKESPLGETLVRLRERKIALDGEAPNQIAFTEEKTAVSPSVPYAEILLTSRAGSEPLFTTTSDGSIWNLTSAHVTAPSPSMRIVLEAPWMEHDRVEEFRNKWTPAYTAALPDASENRGQDEVFYWSQFYGDPTAASDREIGVKERMLEEAIKLLVEDEDYPNQSEVPIGVKFEQNPTEKDFKGYPAYGLFSPFHRQFWLDLWNGLPQKAIEAVAEIPEFKDGYYDRASLFLEQAERLGELAKSNRQKLLGELSRSSVAELLNIYQLNQPKIPKPKELAEALNNAVLNRLLVKKIQGRIEEQIVEIELQDDFKVLDWLKENSIENPLELFENERLPISLAQEFLSLADRKEEEPFFADRSSPDTAFNGPSLIGKSVHDGQLQLAVEAAQVRVLLSNLPRKRGDEILKQLVELDDDWFAKRKITLENYQNYFLLEYQGNELGFSEIAAFLLANEHAIDRQKVQEFCELVPGDSTLAKFEIQDDFSEGNTNRKPSNLQAACRLRLIEWALSKPPKPIEETGIVRTTVANWAKNLVGPTDEKEGQNDSHETPENSKSESVDKQGSKRTDQEKALFFVAELFDPQFYSYRTFDGTEQQKKNFADQIYRRKPGTGFSNQELIELAAARFVSATENHHTNAEFTVRRIVHGRFGNLDGIENVGEELFKITWFGKLLVLLTILGSLMLFCFFFLNPNSTSLHGFYKRKLADAFIIKSEGDSVFPEGEVRLSELSNYKSGSTSPYHLINVAINMQGSDNPNIRDRNADFFVFSKNYIGGESTGYLSTEEFESAASDVTAATAMAISAGAASPNMGQYTISVLSFLLTMVNLRLGYWIPNPKELAAKSATKELRETRSFDEAFAAELKDIAERRKHADCDRPNCSSISDNAARISIKNQLLGMALSGGGIRSAAVNLGNAQVLQDVGLFAEIDYLSTVSGGGYLGTSLSTLMRNGLEPIASDVNSETPSESGDEQSDSPDEESGLASNRDSEGGRKSNKRAKPKTNKIQVGRRRKWRPRASLLLREMVGMLHSKSKWINVSDGGHVENLGAFELLRRRCAVVIVGEGESDAAGGFPGLSTLMRLAEIDLGVEIDFPKGSLQKLILPTNFDELTGEKLQNQIASKRHFAVAKIHYPKSDTQPEEFGYLLYVRSSLRGDEDQIVKSYRKSNPGFPHESTADQMFNEGQFEAYRRLGVKMMEEALAETVPAPNSKIDYVNLRASLEDFWNQDREVLPNRENEE